MSRFRNFCFTSFRVLTDDERTLLFENRNIRFITYQHEKCPTSGAIHLQGYCELFEQRNARSLRELFHADDVPGSPTYLYLGKREGSQRQAIDYANKSDTRILGPFTHGVPANAGQRSDLSKVKSLLDSGETYASVVESCFDTVARCPKFFKEYANLVHNKPRDFKTRVIFLFGPTRTGKTSTAFNAGASFLSITSAGFINGYSHQDVVCFDDIDEKTFKRQDWLRLFDRYPCVIDVKGESNIQWNPKVVYLTSNKTLNEVTCGDAAMIARVDEIIPFGSTITPSAGRELLLRTLSNGASGV